MSMISLAASSGADQVVSGTTQMMKASYGTKICYASCNNLLTRDQTVIGPVIGYLSGAVMLQIADCLKQVMELP